MGNYFNGGVDSINDGEILKWVIDHNGFDVTKTKNGFKKTEVNDCINNRAKLKGNTKKVIDNESTVDFGFDYSFLVVETENDYTDDKRDFLCIDKLKSNIYIEELDSKISKEGKKLHKKNFSDRQREDYAKKKAFKEIKYGRVGKSTKQSKQ